MYLCIDLIQGPNYIPTNELLILFHELYIVKKCFDFSETQDRIMITGRHIVRDVACKKCDTKLGWMYEFATGNFDNIFTSTIISTVCIYIWAVSSKLLFIFGTFDSFLAGLGRN